MSNHDATPAERIEASIAERFGTPISVKPALPGLDELARMTEHRSHRKYTSDPVTSELLRLLLACALSAPSKSDLQQADIVHVADRAKVRAITALIPDMPWIAQAPVLLVFCGDNRRIRQIGEWRGKPFANDHLDHFMNAAVDAGIVMATFIRAAEAVGLGCCPISGIRNRPHEVSELLGLPDWVFPVAGLTAGYPAEPGRITPRLPLEVTVHVDRFDETRVRKKSMPTTSVGTRCCRIASSVAARPTASRLSTAGRKTKRVSIRRRSARISARSSAPKAFPLNN